MSEIRTKQEALAFLKNLCTEINSQDNRCTASPYYFTISEKKKYTTAEGYSDESYEWIHDCESYDDEEAMSIILERYDDEEWEYDLTKEEFENKEYGFEDIIEENEFEKWYYQLIEQRSGFFLTEKGANRYLKCNKHHHEKDATTYVEHAFRNHELEDLLKSISILAEVELGNQ